MRKWKSERIISVKSKRKNFFSDPPFGRNKKGVFAHTFVRSMPIPFSVLGKRVAVHNGKTFNSFNVHAWMIGHKFGEFSLTKRLGVKIHEKIIAKKKRA